MDTTEEVLMIRGFQSGEALAVLRRVGRRSLVK
jgi:hypothetical protein